MKPDETSETETSTEQDTLDGSETATNGHPAPAGSEQKDTFPIQGIDHVEFYVGNAKQAAHFYRTAMGFNITAYAGPETKVRDRASYVLEQAKIRFVVTAPMQPEGEIAEHVWKHAMEVHFSARPGL